MKTKLTDAEILAQCLALDAVYAESEAWHSARAAASEPLEDDEEPADEMAELRKAALSRGQP